jgi:hypothetical protein
MPYLEGFQRSLTTYDYCVDSGRTEEFRICFVPRARDVLQRLEGM